VSDAQGFANLTKASVGQANEEELRSLAPTFEVIKYLTEEGNDATFDFLVQLYVDDEKPPIEDPMYAWQEQDAPFIKLATIKIPAQKFDFEERKRLDEGLSFTPWHTLPEHAPLGSVNLARKKVYQEIAKARRTTINHRLQKPQPYSSVLDDPQ